MSLFKEPFDDNIADQLNIRQDIIGRDNHTSQEITYLNSKTAWIQLRSSVDVEFNGRISADGLATDNVLMGGLLRSGNQPRSGIGSNGLGIYDTSVYNKSLNIIEPNVLGIRPMPGINSISIQSKSAYGSLRQATVNFQCWDVKQLEILETLYMRPGYTVLLEWGWIPYIDNKTKKLISRINQDEDFFKHKNINIQKYLSDLRGRALGSSGNYDAMFGYIKNYSWKYRQDGGYDCTTEIISTGEILESLKINYSGTSISSNSSGTLLSTIQYDEIDNIQKEYRRNALAGLIAETYALVLENNDDINGSGTITYTANNGKTGTIDYAKKEIELEKDGTTSTDSDANDGKKATADYVTDDDSNIYITLRSFVELLNNFILLENPDISDSDKNIIKLSIDDRPDSITPKQPLHCLYHPLQISVDPRVCILKNPLFEKLIQGINISDTTVENNKNVTHITVQPAKLTQSQTDITKELIDASNDKEIEKALNKIKTKEDLSVIADEYARLNPGKTLKDKIFSPLLGFGTGLGEKYLVDKLKYAGNSYDIFKIIGTTAQQKIDNALADEKLKIGGEQYTLDQVKEQINSSKTSYLSVCNQLPQAYHTDDITAQYGVHANIFLNLRTLYNLAGNETLEGQDPAEKQSISLMSYMKDLLTMVQNSIGNVNNFEIIIDGNVGYITDVNYVPPIKTPKAFSFELGSKRSIIRDISLESQIFADQSTIIAVAAQSDAGKLGLENSSMVAYNTGIKDRNIFKKDTLINNKHSIEDQTSGFIRALADLSGLFNSMDRTLGVSDSELLVDNISKYKKSLTDIIAFFTSLYKSDNKYKAILPTKLSLTTDGIGGLIIGNIFDIDKTLTPRAYKGENGIGTKLQYLITNIKQEVGANNQWTTTIEGNPYIPDESFNILTKNQSSIKIGINIIKKYIYDQSTGQIRSQLVTDNTPVGEAPAGIPGNARAMASSLNYTFINGAPGPGGRCARYTYNIAQKYIEFRKNPKANVTRGASLSSGGNANEENWRKTLEKLGYNTTLVATSFTREQMKNYMNTSTWNVGDVVSYFSHNLNHFHAQIFTGGMTWDSSIKSFNLNPKVNKWSSDFPQNYDSAFVYYNKKDSDSYHLYVHKLLS
jgi:hypothetical protein